MSNQSTIFTPDLWESMGFLRHPNNYLYKEITPRDSKVELVLIVWPPGSRSQAHNHGASWNLTWLLPISQQAQLQTTFYRVSQDQLLLDQSAVITGKQFHWVAPHQIHEVANETQSFAVSLHLYFPRRHF